jgi:hypothetical protein
MALQAKVRRRCWGPALAKRTDSTVTTARVVAALVVGSAGEVRSVSLEAPPVTLRAFPGLGACVEEELRSSSLPAPGEPTTVTIPFNFHTQG